MVFGEQVELLRDNSITFDFNKVFSESRSQEEVYTVAVKPLLDSLFKVVNSSLLVYGQSGSGKTWTMGLGKEVSAASK